jgi:hypothetical protein
MIAPRDEFEVLTQFRRAWGTPPLIPGLAWSATRAVYQPERGTRVSSAAHAALFERRAADGIFVQAYRAEDADGAWHFRWVRVPTELPEAGAPYTVLGGVEALDTRPVAAPAPSSALEQLDKQVQFSDALLGQAGHRASTFDMAQYELVGVRHKRGSRDQMVYHLEPRKDLPVQRQDELWEALCTSPDVPALYRVSEEDCRVRRWLRESKAKMK